MWIFLIVSTQKINFWIICSYFIISLIFYIIHLPLFSFYTFYLIENLNKLIEAKKVFEIYKEKVQS